MRTAHQWWPDAAWGLNVNPLMLEWMRFNQYMNILIWMQQAKDKAYNLDGLGQSYGRISGSEWKLR